MRLGDNNQGTMTFKVWNIMYDVEHNVWDSTLEISNSQSILVDELITSDYLIDNIYNEINRE